MEDTKETLDQRFSVAADIIEKKRGEILRLKNTITAQEAALVKWHRSVNEVSFENYHLANIIRKLRTGDTLNEIQAETVARIEAGTYNGA